jgi:hypothetical protein
MLTTTAFWKAAAERAVKTFAQTAAALLTGAATGLLEVDWVQIGSVAGLAALVSLLTSVGSDVVTGSGPSLTNAEVTDPKHRA